MAHAGSMRSSGGLAQRALTIRRPAAVPGNAQVRLPWCLEARLRHPHPTRRPLATDPRSVHTSYDAALECMHPLTIGQCGYGGWLQCAGELSVPAGWRSSAW